jgi:hypothetical protein
MEEPKWSQAELEEAVRLAVLAAADPAMDDARILAHARAPHAYLALVAQAADAARALISVVTHLDGKVEPFPLSTWVPTDKADRFVAQGRGWWPRPETPRWFWTVGHVSTTVDTVNAEFDGRTEVIPVGADGWFAHLLEGDDHSTQATITATIDGIVTRLG